MISTPEKYKRSVGITFTEESMTEQCHADEVKIQNIMKKYRDTGVIEHVNQYQGMYSDMINAPDFAEAQMQIAEAKSMFETVPAHIRSDFDNDPQKFIAFMQEPENVEAIQEYGLDASHLANTPNKTKTRGNPEGTPKQAVQADSEAEASDSAD